MAGRAQQQPDKEGEAWAEAHISFHEGFVNLIPFSSGFTYSGPHSHLSSFIEV